MTTKKEDQKLVFKTNYCLMQVKSIAECSKGNILQYLRPSLSYHLSLRLVLSSFEWPLKTGLTVLIIYSQKPPLNILAEVFSGARSLIVLSLPLLLYFVYARSPSSGEAAQICRLV